MTTRVRVLTFLALFSVGCGGAAGCGFGCGPSTPQTDTAAARKMRFAINIDSAQRAGLRVSSKLLMLARIVRSSDDRTR